MIHLLIAAICLASTATQEELPPGSEHRYGETAPRARPAKTIRVATYNVLNLFDHVDDPDLQGDAEDRTMATTDARCRALAEVILAIDADVVALQEVESEEALRWFRDTYLPEAGYEWIASRDVGYWRGVECSVLSRHPISNVNVWPETSLDDVSRDGPGWTEVPEGESTGLRYQRSPLLVDVTIEDGYQLTLVVVHHKSGRTFGWKREAEALATTKRLVALREADPDRNLIVLGDFNAAPWDKSLRVYLEAGFVDTLAHRLVPRSRSEDRDEGNLYKTHESGRVIDFILLSSATLNEYVPGSGHVYGTPFFPDYDWRNDPHPPGYASDHYPVIIDLRPGP